MKHLNGSESIDPNGHLEAVKHCPCSDGINRLINVTGRALGMTTYPGRASVRLGNRNHSVSGFLILTAEGYEFQVDKKGKNGHLLP